MVVDPYLFLSLAALGAEASNCGAFLTPKLAIWYVFLEAFRVLGLQLVGQVMEDACTVLHRLEEARKNELYS